MENKTLGLSHTLHPELSVLIGDMLSLRSEQRPSIAETFERLKAIDLTKPIKETPKDTVPAPAKKNLKPASAPSTAEPTKPAASGSAIAYIESVGTGQYKITYESGKQRIVPELFIKSQNLEHLVR
jgi:hypothetical protein